MLQITSKHRVFLAVQPIDFRRGIDGIVALCWRQYQCDPKSGHFFIFRNRKATAIKVLTYDGQGFWLCHKRLSRGKFTHWPKLTETAIMLTAPQLQVLLMNGDPLTALTALPWQTIDGS